MNRLPFDIRKLLLVMFVFALPLISINFQRLPGEEPWYMIPITFVSGTIEMGYAGISSLVRGTTAEYMNLIHLKRENRALQSEIEGLRAHMASFNELKQENSRLNQLLDFKSTTPGKLLPAQIIGLDLLSNHSTLRINRGSLDNVKKGQAVIAADGVVGSIYRVEPKTSQVLVLTDRYFVIDAIIQRTRARGIVEGKSPVSCRLKYLQRTDDVQIGDLVVTSGLDDTFPKGFPIGTVTEVEKKAYGVTQKVDVEPSIDPSRLDEVLIVQDLPKHDYVYPTKLPYSPEEQIENDDLDEDLETTDTTTTSSTTSTTTVVKAKVVKKETKPAKPASETKPKEKPQ